MTKFNNDKIKESDRKQAREQGDSREKKNKIKQDKRCRKHDM